mmetsp:Transcript_49254/g.68426  ORF Transcript_49254/g.68426 Transcript_49254/m.68426 type:complete len:452 (-) Transcript_49254:136-1491(-)
MAGWVARLVAMIGVVGAAAGTPINPVPNPIHPAAGLMTELNSSANGRLFQLSSADGVQMKILHTWGTAEEMGEAEGVLLGSFAAEFLNDKIPQFLEETIKSIDLSKLPEWLQKALEGKVGLDAAEAVLGAIFMKEQAQIKTSQSNVGDEIAGLAKGLCASGAIEKCSTSELTRRIQHLNMFPELVRMTCSMFGAWGDATADGKLIQLRTLDFGTGPWANYAVVHVYHPDVGNPFVSMSFPGFAGAITGFSTKIAISEKVWETYVDGGVQPGNYNGMPDSLVLRDLLQFANSRDDAIAYTERVNRNWAIFIGVGDGQEQEFSALGYREQGVDVLGPMNVTNVTHMPVLSNTVYIDKHPQPSHDQNTMPGLLQKYHGNLTGELTANTIPRLMQSGDVHIGVYDFGNRQALLATGKVDDQGKYLNATGMQEGMAYNQPFIEFDMDALFNVTRAE